MNESTAKNQALRQITTVLSSPPMFDHEKLDVYQLELLFIAWVTPLLEEVAAAHGRTREACDQLDRASLSALLNTAEGNGKRQRPVRAKFFDDARGSATECAGCLDALVAKRAVTEERILDGKRILVRIVSILCALVDRFDNPGQLKDEPLINTFDSLPEPQRVRYSTKISRTRTTTRRNRE
jgi:four helix bundle protein